MLQNYALPQLEKCFTVSLLIYSREYINNNYNNNNKRNGTLTINKG